MDKKKPVSENTKTPPKSLEKEFTAKKTELEIEIDDKWVPAEKAVFGKFITGARFNTSETRVKTVNGWFNETDPAKSPVIMVETADKSIKISAHIKGGEWLPLSDGKSGCNIPIDGLRFFKKEQVSISD